MSEVAEVTQAAKTSSQKQQILRWLKTGREITPLDALKAFDCLNLAARVHELRNEGYQISARKAHGNGYAIYRLETVGA